MFLNACRMLNSFFVVLMSTNILEFPRIFEPSYADPTVKAVQNFTESIKNEMETYNRLAADHMNVSDHYENLVQNNDPRVVFVQKWEALQGEISALSELTTDPFDNTLKLFKKSYTYHTGDSFAMSKKFFNFELENGDCWTLVQRRLSGALNFNRNWLSYKLGFGSLYGEYWIGLQKLQQLSVTKNLTLRIKLLTYEDEKITKDYEGFRLIGDEYILHLADENYSDESFSAHKGMKFSTYDHDNSNGYENCAVKHGSGWWFNDCFESNLNGIYYSESNQNTGSEEGIIWKTYSTKYSLRATWMFVKEKGKEECVHLEKPKLNG